MPAALAVRGLEKRYGAVRALAGVDLEVGEGELVGLLGPNGAGKSTLVKIACGLVRPTRGTATICGAPAGSAPARGRGDVEGDAAAPRDRPGARWAAAAPPPRRADERARPGWPPHRAEAARGAPRPGRRRP